MNLPSNQRSVLLALTTDWQTPIQIAAQLPNGDLNTVNQALKDLMSKGFVQVNPVVFSMYRLTSNGTATKEELLGE